MIQIGDVVVSFDVLREKFMPARVLVVLREMPGLRWNWMK